jgi:hypothetical protein
MPDQKYRNLIYIGLLLFFNIQDCWKQQADIFYWLQSLLPFIIVIPIIIFFKLIPLKYRFKIEAIIYLIFAAACFVLNGRDGLTGAMFLYLFCFCWGSKPLLIISLAGSLITIVFKFDSMGITNSETIKYLIGCIFIVDKLFTLTWPKKPDILKRGMIDMTQTHEYIITYLRHGFNQKQIAIASQSWKADEKNLTYDQIHGRVSELFEIFGAENTAHLIELLWRGGYIKQTIVNFDKQSEK